MEEKFYPDLIKGWGVSNENFETIKLGDDFEKESGTGGRVVLKWRGVLNNAHITFCRSSDQCSICPLKDDRKQCQAPLS